MSLLTGSTPISTDYMTYTTDSFDDLTDAMIVDVLRRESGLVFINPVRDDSQTQIYFSEAVLDQVFYSISSSSHDENCSIFARELRKVINDISYGTVDPSGIFAGKVVVATTKSVISVDVVTV